MENARSNSTSSASSASSTNSANTGTGNNPERRVQRLACDRCHGQKLRCTRDTTERKACQRCIKAGEKCTYSPPLRFGRPVSKASRQQRQQQQQQQQQQQPAPPPPPPPAPQNDQVSVASTPQTNPGLLDQDDGFSVSPSTSSSTPASDLLDNRINDLFYSEVQSSIAGYSPATMDTPELEMLASAFTTTPFPTDMDFEKDSSLFMHSGCDSDPASQAYSLYNLDDLQMYPPNTFLLNASEHNHTPPDASNFAVNLNQLPRSLASDGDATQKDIYGLLGSLQNTSVTALLERPEGFKEALEETVKVSNALLEVIQQILDTAQMLQSSTSPDAVPTTFIAGVTTGSNLLQCLTIATCYVQILQNIQTLSAHLRHILSSDRHEQACRALTCIQIGSGTSSLVTPTMQAGMIAQLLLQVSQELQKKISRLSCGSTAYSMYMRMSKGADVSSFSDIMKSVNCDVGRINVQVQGVLAGILRS